MRHPNWGTRVESPRGRFKVGHSNYNIEQGDSQMEASEWDAQKGHSKWVIQMGGIRAYTVPQILELAPGAY